MNLRKNDEVLRMRLTRNLMNEEIGCLHLQGGATSRHSLLIEVQSVSFPLLQSSSSSSLFASW